MEDGKRIVEDREWRAENRGLRVKCGGLRGESGVWRQE